MGDILDYTLVILFYQLMYFVGIITSFPSSANYNSTKITSQLAASNKNSKAYGYIALVVGPLMFILILLLGRVIQNYIAKCGREEYRGLDKINSIFEFRAADIDGNMVNLEKYQGNVCVFVNAGAACGHKSVPYKDLVELDRKYKEHGLRILVFLCDPFGNQYNTKKPKIKSFIEKQWGIEFDVYEKLDGHHEKHAHPLFTYLKLKQAGRFDWFLRFFNINFTTFITNQQGQPVARFGPWGNPISAIENTIHVMLEKNHS